ncbi:MAG TPA: hypothetical protein VFI96_02175 [Longimicrobiaceae bacterium]|nr:hypothetical protein [Longimicrobiaceae bacterium]
MKRIAMVLGPLLLTGAALSAPPTARAQQGTRTVEVCPGGSLGTTARPTSGPTQREQAYDVVVDVPNLCVRRLSLEVDNLDAHIALNARVANLLRVDAGADVGIGQVKLGITGVRAQALLLVDLDDVYQIVDHTLTFIDNNPQIVNQLVGTVGHTVRAVGTVANTALQPGGVVDQTVGVVGQTLNQLTRPGGVLTQTVNSLGQTVQLTLGQTGDLVAQTLDTAGKITNQRTLGNLLQLPVLQQTTNAAGQVVKRVRDQAGNVLEYTLDSAGKLLGARVVQTAREP